jgi:predicted Zn-dependent peptidase
MQAANRRVPPKSDTIGKIDLPPINKDILSLGVPLYWIRGVDAEALRLDFVFDAGVKHQPQGAVAPATAALLTEGTHYRNARQIADDIDFWGAYLNSRCYADDAVVTLYCLQKHLPDCNSILMEVLTEASFPEPEVQVYKDNSIQKLKVNEEKNMFLARRTFSELLFGRSSAYGSYSKSEDYAKISREIVDYFHASFYRKGLKYVMATGDVRDTSVSLLSETLALPPSIVPRSTVDISPPVTGVHTIVRKDAVQVAIKTGRPLFNRLHPDYQPMQVLNMVLGGYFGSRLMKNIREEKGLTYGIYSAVESYRNSGSFYVETEVNPRNYELAQQEIRAEIFRLQREPISADELELARNYMLGSFLRSTDSPFSLADRYKILIDYETDTRHYNQYIETLRTITPDKLMEIAIRYLDPNQFTTVLVGSL